MFPEEQRGRGYRLRHDVGVLKLASLAAGLAVVVVVAGLNVVVAAARVTGDPPVLVPWNRIGDITLGELQARVQSEYGTEGYGYHVAGRDGDIIEGYYRLHGSPVAVVFQGGRVHDIGFATRYYRTTSGFRVGSAIPLGPCHKTATNPCEHRWRGFVWNGWVKATPCKCWVKVGRGAKSLAVTPDNFMKPWTFIYATHGRVTGIHLAWKFVD